MQHVGERQLKPDREQQQHDTDLRKRRNVLGFGNQRNAVWADNNADKEKSDEGRHAHAMGQRDDRDRQTDDDRQVAKHAKVAHGDAVSERRSGFGVTALNGPLRSVKSGAYRYSSTDGNCVSLSMIASSSRACVRPITPLRSAPLRSALLRLLE